MPYVTWYNKLVSQRSLEDGATIYLDKPPNKPLPIPPGVSVYYDADHVIQWAPPYFELYVVAVRKILAPTFPLETGATVYVDGQYLPKKNGGSGTRNDGLQDRFQQKMF